MKTIKYTIILLILIIAGINVQSQINSHAVVQDGAISGQAISAAYGLSELDVYCNNTGMVSFVSAFTYEDNAAGRTFLHFRRTDGCIGKYENYYHIANSGTSSSSVPRGAFTVADVKEVKATGGLEIVFCGSYHGKEAYIGMLDRHLNPIGDINGYQNVAYLNSIIEFPGHGFIACGEGLNNNGIVIAVDYNLNLISSYEISGYIYTDLDYDPVDKYIYMAGYSPNELSVVAIDPAQMYLGSPNPAFDGFLYHDINYNIEWNKSGRDDIKIISLGGKIVALGASGESNSLPGRNIGIFHINSADGGSPMHNIYYNLNGANVYFKEFVNFGNDYNLLLQEDGSNNPFIVQMNPWQFLGNWDAIRIAANVNTDMSMFKRDNCRMIDFLTFNNNLLYYSDCHSQVVGITYHSVEQPQNFPVLNTPANTYKFYNLNPIAVYHTPNLLTMFVGAHSHINPIISYNGNCYDYCTRSAVVENDMFGNEEIESEVSSIMIYDNIIEISETSEYSDYQIFDIMGRVIVKSKVDKNIISTSGIPHGTYIIHLSKTNGEIEHHKFIRQ